MAGEHSAGLPMPFREQEKTMTSIRTCLAATTVLPLILGFAPMAIQTAQAQTTADTAADSARDMAMADKPDPDALAALDKMGVALRNLKFVAVKGDVTTDQVLVSGQKIQFGGTIDITAIRPDKLKMVIKSDHQERVIYYDGKAVTVFAPAKGFYASAPAPATIGEALKTAKTKYDFELPLADLFLWGTDPTLTQRVKSGFDAGPETINSVAVEHYVFRQENVDWQVWISADGLPLKLVITSTDDPSQPQYSSVLTWGTEAPSADSFAFVPPAEAHRIALTEVPDDSK
jgi:hypothetical protein